MGVAFTSGTATEQAFSPAPSSRLHGNVDRVAASGPRQAAGLPHGSAAGVYQAPVSQRLCRGPGGPRRTQSSPRDPPHGPMSSERRVGATGSCGWCPRSGRQTSKVLPTRASVTAQQRVEQACLPGTAFVEGNASATSQGCLFCVWTGRAELAAQRW